MFAGNFDYVYIFANCELVDLIGRGGGVVSRGQCDAAVQSCASGWDLYFSVTFGYIEPEITCIC